MGLLLQQMKDTALRQKLQWGRILAKINGGKVPVLVP